MKDIIFVGWVNTNHAPVDGETTKNQYIIAELKRYCNVLPMVLIGKSHPVDCKIVIEDNCLINTSVTILGPITIGNNVTIGAGAVVNKDVPDNAIIAGVQGKVIRYKTQEG